MTTRQLQDARHREAVRAYYATGDEALLSPVLTELRPRLTDFLRSKGLRDVEQTEDLVQEVLVEVITKLRAHKYTDTGSVASWALAICWHDFVNSLLRKTNTITQPGRDENPFLLLPASVATPAEELPISQEDEQQASTVVAAATQAVLGLDPNARVCVLLHYYQGLSETAAAARLGIAETTFRARLRRGLSDLRAWGSRHRHLAPAPDVYAALLRVSSGDLFREPLCLAS
jgi:RNA polymerase sigma factor (sigma-70 family)